VQERYLLVKYVIHWEKLAIVVIDVLRNNPHLEGRIHRRSFCPVEALQPLTAKSIGSYIENYQSA
jgi:hypothetical protein